MDRLEQYAAWIVANANKKGTQEFNTVAAAYKELRSAGAQNFAKPAGFWGSLVESAKTLGAADEAVAYANNPTDENRRKLLAAAQPKSTHVGFGEGRNWEAFKEMLGGSIGQQIAPVIAGAVAGIPAGAATAAPIAGAGALTGPGELVAAPVAGIAGAASGITAGRAAYGAVSAAQYATQNIIRQAQEAQAAAEAGRPIPPVSLGKTAIASAAQAGLDILELGMFKDLFKKVPIVKSLFSGGERAAQQSAEKIAEAATKGTFKTVAGGMVRGVAKGVIFEAPQEVVQQALERWQAGLPLNDKDAAEEYLQAAIGGALLGGVLGAPSGAIGAVGARTRAREELSKTPPVTEEGAPPATEEPTTAPAAAPAATLDEQKIKYLMETHGVTRGAAEAGVKKAIADEDEAIAKQNIANERRAAESVPGSDEAVVGEPTVGVPKRSRQPAGQPSAVGPSGIEPGGMATTGVPASQPDVGKGVSGTPLKTEGKKKTRKEIMADINAASELIETATENTPEPVKVDKAKRQRALNMALRDNVPAHEALASVITGFSPAEPLGYTPAPGAPLATPVSLSETVAQAAAAPTPEEKADTEWAARFKASKKAVPETGPEEYTAEEIGGGEFLVPPSIPETPPPPDRTPLEKLQAAPLAEGVEDKIVLRDIDLQEKEMQAALNAQKRNLAQHNKYLAMLKNAVDILTPEEIKAGLLREGNERIPATPEYVEGKTAELNAEIEAAQKKLGEADNAAQEKFFKTEVKDANGATRQYTTKEKVVPAELTGSKEMFLEDYRKQLSDHASSVRKLRDRIVQRGKNYTAVQEKTAEKARLAAAKLGSVATDLTVKKRGKPDAQGNRQITLSDGTKVMLRQVSENPRNPRFEFTDEAGTNQPTYAGAKYQEALKKLPGLVAAGRQAVSAQARIGEVQEMAGDKEALRGAYFRRFRDELDRLGLKGVSLRMLDKLEAAAEGWREGTLGTYEDAKKLISLILNPGRASFDHEVMHAIEGLRVLENEEIHLVELAALKDPEIVRYVAKNYGDKTKAEQGAERRAELYSKWQGNQQKYRERLPVSVVNALQKIQGFLDAARRWLTGVQFNSAEEVFRAIHAGEVGKRKPTETAAPVVSAVQEARAKKKAVDNDEDISEGLKKVNQSFKSNNPRAGVEGIGQTVKGHSVDPIVDLAKNRYTDMEPTFLKVLLKAFPTSGIVDWMGDVIPPLRTILNTISEMRGAKNKLLRNFTEHGKELKAFVHKNGQEIIGKTMMLARINRFDPTPYKTLQDALTKDPVLVRYTQKLADPALDASTKTRLENGRKKRALKINEVWSLWEKLGAQDGGHAIFKQTQDFYRDMYVIIRGLLSERLKKLPVDPSVNAALERALDDDMSSTGAEPEDDEHSDIEGAFFPRVYFPAKRFGKFYYQVKEGGVGGKEFYVFETASARDKSMYQRAKDLGVSVADFGQGNDISDLRETMRRESSVLSKAFNAIDKATEKGLNKAALKDELYQIYLTLLPERAVRKQFIHADMVTGFQFDVLRNFATSADQYANQVTKLEFTPKLDAAVSSAYDVISDRPDQAKLKMFVTEVEKRAREQFNPPERGALVTALNRVAFTMFLTSGATAATQTTAIPIRVMPSLWANYGFGKASATWARYMNVFGAVGASTVGKDGKTRLASPSVKLSAIVRNDPLRQKAFAYGEDHAAFDIGTAAMLENKPTPESAAAGAAADAAKTAMDMLGWMFSTSERLSREATYMMTFDLHYAKTKNFEEACAAAVATVNDKLGDYSDFERPSLLKSEIGRAAGLFKMYAVKQTQFFVGSGYAMLKGKTPAERNAAMNELVGVLVMGSLFAGVTGLPMYSFVTGFIDKWLDMFQSDEDKRERYLRNPVTATSSDLRFRYEWLPAHFGDNAIPGIDGKMHRLSDVLMNGPASELSDVNIGSRTTFDHLWFREGKQGDTLTDTIINNIVSNIAGVSSATNFSDAINDFQNGDTLRGLEKFAPAFFRGGFTAYRLATEGAETRMGEDILPAEKISPVNLAGQVIGFQPTVLSEIQTARALSVKAEKKIDTERQQLLRRLNRERSDPEGSYERAKKAYDAIVAFNRKYQNPDVMISDQTIENSFRDYMRTHARNIRGTMVTKKMAPYMAPVLLGAQPEE